MIDSPVIFDTLYRIVTFGHGPSFPSEFGIITNFL
jgi:hypothetical protein